MHAGDLMPREKALAFGINSLSNVELIALILKTGYLNKDVFELAEELIDVADGFENILSLSYEELISIKGIKEAKGLEIMAILEMSKRLSKIQLLSKEMDVDFNSIINYLRFEHGFSNREEFVVLYLNARSKIIKVDVEFIGNKNTTIIGIDDILRKALLLKARSIIIAHNHPGKSITPSDADIKLTNALSQSAAMMGIPLLDHLIITNGDFFSFKRARLLW